MTNLAAWLLERARPETAALWDAGRWWTYGELSTRMRQVAALLRDRGAAGTIVLLSGENSFAMVAAYLGTLYAGAIPAPLPPSGARTIDEIVRETGARLALAAAPSAPSFRDSGLEVLDLEAASTVEATDPATLDPRGLALVLYTSGSTGTPRGVMLSPENLEYSATAILAFAPLTEHDRALVTLPFYYCYGLSVLHTHLRAGAAVVLASSSLPDRLMDIAEATGATGIPGVPSLFQILLARSLARRDLPSVRYVMVSGGKATQRLIADLRSALPRATIYLRYGITEVTAAASCLAPELVGDKPGSIGRGLRGAALEVVREDGTPVVAGPEDVGEIVIRGPHVGLGYYGDRRETEPRFRAGAFYTGDRAWVDADGDVFIVGREREFLKIAGHRVSPHEIEEAISALPEVADVAVVGVPHRIRGEAVAAVVVVRAGATLDLAAVARHCAARLAPWKVPSALRLVEALPRRDNGKLDRRALQQMLASR